MQSSTISGSLKCSRRPSNVSSVIARWSVAIRSPNAIAARSASFRSGASRRALERADECFGDPVVEALRVAHGHAAAALVPEGDAEPDELEQPVGEQPVLAQGEAELEELQRELRTLGVDLDAQRHVGVAEERFDLLG